MNCQEVMEYMQRQLDLDLTEAEQALLEEHMASCSSCREMMGRLQRLTEELSNLYKVHPPVSLVDAILPRLAEIDEAKQAASTDVQATEAQVSRADRRPRKQSRIPYKTLGGVIAAGILLGVAIVNWNGAGSPDQFQAANSAGNMNASGNEVAISMFHDDAARAGQRADVRAPEADKEASDIMNNHSGYQIEAYPGETDGEPSSGALGFQSGGDSGTDDPAPSERYEEQFFYQEDDVMDVDPSAGGEEVSDTTDVKIEFAEELDPSSPGLSSPDGAFSAHIVNNSVVIMNTDHEKVYTSETFDDAEIYDLEWQEEMRLTFKAKSDQEETYYIDLSSHTEGKLQ